MVGLLPALLFGGGYWLLGWPQIGPTTMTNKSGAVSLSVPAGWTGTTPWNSPRTVWPLVGGPSRVSWPTIGGAHKVEDIRLVTGDLGSQTQITIYLDIADRKLATMHAREFDEDFRKNDVAVASPVPGPHRSLATISRQADGITEIVTLRAKLYVVTAVVSAPNEAALQAADDVLSTLTVRNDK